MSDVLTPDLCVIGAGAAGLSVAATAGALGVPVVLIERGRMGGDCLNVGCVPSKALIASAHAAHAAREAHRYGVGLPAPEIDFASAMRRVHAVIAGIAPLDSAERFRALGVMVIQGEARFADARSVTVGETTIRARRFVVASGSRPAVPPIEGLTRTPFLTNETVWELTQAPERLIVIGAGPIGAELSQAFARLGSQVTLLDAGPFLSREDPELSEVARNALIRDGVIVRDHVRIARVEGSDGAVAATILGDAGEETVSGTHLLIATGRKPNVEDLGLEAAGIAFDRSGITVDSGLRATNRRVYAIGDCAGGAAGTWRFTHVCSQHASLVIRNALFRAPATYDPNVIPRVTFTDPEIAGVGLDEAAARATVGAIRVLRFPFAENDRARAEGLTQGHVKIIADRKGRVLGVGIVGPRAGEMAPLWTLAIRKRMRLSDVIGTVFPYPTFSETTRRAAVEFLAPSAASPVVRGLIGLLRRFG